jgi:hypothetical protein
VRVLFSRLPRRIFHSVVILYAFEGCAATIAVVLRGQKMLTEG